MSVDTITGYGEEDYLEGPYLTGTGKKEGGAQALFIVKSDLSKGSQSNFVIEGDTPVGSQSLFVVKDDLPFGSQFNGINNDDKNIGSQFIGVPKSQLETAMQVDFLVKSDDSIAMQFNGVNPENKGYGSQLESFNPSEFHSGMQTQFVVTSKNFKGSEIRIDKYPTITCEVGYLDDGYLGGAYLQNNYCLVMGAQTKFTVRDKLSNYAAQTEFVVKDALKQAGAQAELVNEEESYYGSQLTAVKISSYGSQFTSVVYNTHNLRILCEFPSRGLVDNNWVSNSTKAGDFDVNNINTDIVEQVWKSADGVKSGLTLTCDTGIVQGVYTDTLAILNTNLTKSATVRMILSNDPSFSSVVDIVNIKSDSDNIYYVAEQFPNFRARYIRITIDDQTNPDTNISIGTLVFGTSEIFAGECFVDEVQFEQVDFTDSVNTEGFTNVSNSRALRRKVQLEFRMLNFQKRNFKILRSMFETYRTTHKCLWIPTPSPTDSDVTKRFSAFAKLVKLPTENHRYHGSDADYVSFGIEYDESR